MPVKNRQKARDSFGIVTGSLSGLIYLFAVFFFVMPLSERLDTFLVVSWVFVPAIIGSFVYHRLANRGSFDQPERDP